MPGEHSERRSWEEVAAAEPDVVVVMPCGYDAARAHAEALAYASELARARRRRGRGGRRSRLLLPPRPAADRRAGAARAPAATRRRYPKLRSTNPLDSRALTAPSLLPGRAGTSTFTIDACNPFAQDVSRWPRPPPPSSSPAAAPAAEAPGLTTSLRVERLAEPPRERTHNRHGMPITLKFGIDINASGRQPLPAAESDREVPVRRRQAERQTVPLVQRREAERAHNRLSACPRGSKIGSGRATGTAVDLGVTSSGKTDAVQRARAARASRST